MQFEIKAARIADRLAVIVSSPKGRIGRPTICTLHSCPPNISLQGKKLFDITIHVINCEVAQNE